MRVYLRRMVIRASTGILALSMACAAVPANAAIVTWKLTGTFIFAQDPVSTVFSDQATPNLTAFITFDNSAVADSSTSIEAIYGPGGNNTAPNVTISYLAGNGTTSVSGTANGGSIDVINDWLLVGSFHDQYSLFTSQQAPTGATGPGVTDWQPYYLRLDVFDDNIQVESMLTSTAVLTDPASMLLVNPGKIFYIFYTPAGPPSGQISQALFAVDSITLVPLPGALVFMLSGVGLLAAARRKHT